MTDYNLLTLALILLFSLPIIIGLFKPFSRERVQFSIGSLFDNIEFLTGLILSIYFTKRIFFENSQGVFKTIYEWIPETARGFLYGKDVLTYIIGVPLLLFFILVILRILTGPLYKIVVVPMSKWIYVKVREMKAGYKRIVSALWQLPKAVYLPLIFALLLNFYSYYFHTPILSKWMNESQPYQFIYQNVLSPVLNSNIAKRIPVLVNDSFRNALGEVIPSDSGVIARQIGNKLTEELNIKVIEYFNGVTLDQAVKSNEEIDKTAQEITAEEESSKEKAFALYEWVSGNLEYDFEKAEKISKDPRGIESGAVVAFNKGKGICFDFSSLYIAMCRAVGLKVRMITGLAYSGLSWGDHAWNQVFIPEENRWIDVDTTFGSIAKYFDKNDFDVDHKYAQVQGEW